VTKTGLTLDNHVRDIHLAAQGGKPDNELDRVNVVGDDDETSTLLLNKLGHVVETVLEDLGLGGCNLLTSSLGGGGSLKTGSLLLGTLGTVRGEEAEEVGSLVLVKSLSELVDAGGNLETLHEDGLLALDTHITRPLHVTGQVKGAGTGILTDAVVTSILLEEVAVLRLKVLLGGGLLAADGLLGGALLLSYFLCLTGLERKNKTGE
jgi:hypothetical protein